MDDLGWGDVSWHRADASPENQTPHMAALVAEGVEINRLYTYHMCTPSRSSFLSGRLPVHVETALPNPEDPNQGVPRNMTSLAQKLKAQGYATHVVGKVCVVAGGEWSFWRGGLARTPPHNPSDS